MKNNPEQNVTDDTTDDWRWLVMLSAEAEWMSNYFKDGLQKYNFLWIVALDEETSKLTKNWLDAEFHIAWQ